MILGDFPAMLLAEEPRGFGPGRYFMGTVDCHECGRRYTPNVYVEAVADSGRAMGWAMLDLDQFALAVRKRYASFAPASAAEGEGYLAFGAFGLNVWGRDKRPYLCSERCAQHQENKAKLEARYKPAETNKLWWM